MRETSQDAGVDAIGFRENAQGVGVIASLSRIDDDDRQLSLVKRDDERNFVAADGFDDDPFDMLLLQDLHDASNAVGIVGEGVKSGIGEVGEVEGFRGDVDSETVMDRGVWDSRIIHSDWPILANAGLLSMAQAIVRVDTKKPACGSSFGTVPKAPRGKRTRRSNGTFQSSLRDVQCFLFVPAPAMNRWAIAERPYGSKNAWTCV